MEADDGFAGAEVSCPGCGLTFNAPSSADSGSPPAARKGKKEKKKPKAQKQFSLLRSGLCAAFCVELSAVIGLFVAGFSSVSFGVSTMFFSLVGLILCLVYMVRSTPESFMEGEQSSLVTVASSALGGLNLFVVIALMKGCLVALGMQAPGTIAGGTVSGDGEQALVFGERFHIGTRAKVVNVQSVESPRGTKTTVNPNKREFTMGWYGYLQGWTLTSGEELATARFGKITAISYGNGAPVPLAVAGNEDGVINVWDTRDGVATASFALSDSIGGVALLDQGRVAVGAGGGLMVMWDTRSREKVFEQPIRRSVVTSMTSSTDGRRVAVAMRESMGAAAGTPLPPGFMKDAGLDLPDVVPGGVVVSLAIWEVDPDNRRPRTVGSTNYRGETVGRIRGMAFSPQGDRFLVGAEQGYVYLYELKDRKLRQLSMGHYPDGIRTVAFSRTGKYVAAGTTKGGILLFENNLEEPLDSFSVGSRPVNVLSPSKNPGEFFYAAGNRIRRLKVN